MVFEIFEGGLLVVQSLGGVVYKVRVDEVSLLSGVLCFYFTFELGDEYKGVFI